MKPANDRAQAVIILEQLLKKNQSLSQGFDEEPHLSSLSKAICFGVCRHYYRLQTIADKLCLKRPKSQSVWLVLLVGLHELLYLDKPAYAAVKETVDLLAPLKESWAKGFVNAILRTFCRDRDVILQQLQSQEMFLYGQPAWFLKRLKKEWPHQWQAISMANDAHPPMSLRVNLKKISRDAYLHQLQTAGLDAKVLPYSSAGLTLNSPCSVQDLPGFSDGEVSLQDEAAQLAVSLLQLQPGLRILDACAAPGGKTCHILESEPDLSVCVALDVNAHRLEHVRENLQRLHLNATLLLGDAAEPNDWWDGQLFDRILLDAPCSALGVIRRHPDIKLLRTPNELDLVVKTQHLLLRRLWPLLREGGIMVYATCSVMPQENEQQIVSFIEDYSDCESAMPQVPWGHATGHGRQILPGEANCDGFFYSVLRKITAS